MWGRLTRLLWGGVLFPTLLLATPTFVLKNEGILPDKTVAKIEEIGSELYRKSGIALYLVALEQMPVKSIIEYERQLARQLTPPFVLLTFSLKDRKVDIYTSSPEVEELFDKEQVLSPFPWSGTIIPILESHSKNPKAAVEAALLNGYADIAEQIAASRGFELASGIGNTNRNIYRALRLLFYTILALILANFFYRRILRR
ncbi:MAG: hypothetical protein C6I00_05960 [Nitratiruptor sp.]|nr:hypothetical protein [Nitratiruptor sp.]NPA82987.1 TPM domain-containing protein [Campylobacterota bacterium]